MKPKLLVAVASPLTIDAFLITHLKYLSEQFDITVMFPNLNNEWQAFIEKHPALSSLGFVNLPIRRKPSLFSDLACLLTMARLVRGLAPQVMLTVTPKAGLLGALSAWLNGVPVRVHIFTGQVWATRTGFVRFALKALDRLIATITTAPLADSQSQIDFLESQRIAPKGRIRCIHQGSISGVDSQRFSPAAVNLLPVRQKHGVPEADILFVFVGRLTRDKGIAELLRAFEQVNQQFAACSLLVVGPDEENMEQSAAPHPKVRFVGKTSQPEAYMAAADVFVLPSYREGFGTVVIEAAACGTPTVATNIYGLSDAVVDGETGLLVPVGDQNKLAEALLFLAANPEKRTLMGEAAQQRAMVQFSQHAVSTFLVNFLVAQS
ncbi:glycosyltransferase [Limnobacter sp.]|uniref:glycosyltransferase n=1 Tax=Limnobacter sp. TaxID=2003368 RepID=UPI0027BA0958|nr:glycosyltransferase [Limnobacter sp.]